MTSVPPAAIEAATSNAAASTAATPDVRSLAKRTMLWFFTAVRAMRAGTPPACRYLPTCSAYAVEAVEIHGAVKGTWLATRRVCRCHPLGSHGLDPVPPASPSLETPDV